MKQTGIPLTALQMHYTPPRLGYLPGERLAANITLVEDGAHLTLHLLIEGDAGGGFAGQVYRATVLSVTPPGWPERVAVKVLRPRSTWKRGLRDTLFWLCFQAPFAPQVEESAVCSGLLWQAVLRAAAGCFFGPFSVARPLGYFWEPRMCSFVELHEWIDSRPARYETDPQLIPRWLGFGKTPAMTEMARKQRFMNAMAGLCREMGAVGLARQYDWYTLVSQANVLTRSGVETDIQSAFTVVDCRVGLAFPFFLPFTPVHLRIALAGLRRGRLVHYDEVDLPRLKAYLEAHPDIAGQVHRLLGRLEQADRDYRAALPDLWQARTRLLSDAAFRRQQAAAGLARWVRLNLAAPQTAQRLAAQPLSMAFLMLLYLLPMIGPLVVRLAAHPGYRTHLRRLLVSGAYRRAWLEAARVRDLPEWISFGRVTLRHAALLARSAAAYLLERTACAWLPAAAQRWLTDREARLAWVRTWLFQPLWLIASPGARIAWLDGIVQGEQERGLIHANRAAILRGQIREPRMQQIVLDLGFVAGLEVFSRLVYLVLGLYGISTGNLLPLGVAALSPIPPSGIPRLLYVLARTIQDIVSSLAKDHRFPHRRQLLARFGELVVAPWRWVGNLFPLFEVTAYYPRLALLLAEHFANRAVHNVPVFGGRGKLLEYWTFQLIYNVPVSLKALLSGFKI